jgi:glycosyltransferase involved in cell wall biosynthesis
MTRIVQICADGSPGGGATVVLSLVDHQLRQSALDVGFVSDTDSYAIRRATALGAKTYGLDFWSSRLNPSTMVRMTGLLKRLRPDLVHVHGARAAINIVPAMMRLGARRPRMVYTVHGYQFGNGRPFLRSAVSVAEKLCHAVADVSVFVSRYDHALGMRHRLLSSRRPAEIIPNGVCMSALPAPSAPDERLVVFLGRLSREKNPLLLVDIAALLRPHGYRVKIVGGGAMEPAVRALIAERGLHDVVSVTGLLDRSLALQEIHNAGVLVLPSLHEGFPMVLLEAMAMRVPVVAAAVCGIPELITDGASGLLVDDGNAHTYAAAIRRIAENPDLRFAMVENAQKLVREHYQEDVMVARYAALYERCLDGGRPRGNRAG